MSIIAGWIVVAAMAGLLATQIAGWSRNPYVVALQALTPYVVALALPVVVLAVASRAWAMAGAAIGIPVSLAVIGRSFLFPIGQRAALAGASPLRVFHANLLYANPRPEGIPDAIASVGADVLAFTEYTPRHASILLQSPLADTYPFRVEYPDIRAAGSAIWSRYALSEIGGPGLHFRPCVAAVASPQPITLVVVHPLSPIVSTDTWNDDLGKLRARDVEPNDRVMLIGDFNACHWHPPFRRLLATGWRDAHQVTNHRFSNSWPADRRMLPPFVGIDHALVNDRLVVTETRDIDVPGSDHRGFLVTVVAATDEANALCVSETTSCESSG